MKKRKSQYFNIFTKKFLQQEYIEKGRSLYSIAKEFGTNEATISRHIIKNGLSVRQDNRSNRFDINEQYLIEEYINKNRSASDIAKENGCCSHTIHRKLEKFKIPKRKNKFGFLGAYKNISKAYFNNIKRKAKERKIKFDIKIEYIWDLFQKQNGKCALTGLDLKLEPQWNQKTNQTASLDRIDSSKGYIKGNLQWLHKDVNQMKWTLTQDRFKEICRMVINYDSL